MANQKAHASSKGDHSSSLLLWKSNIPELPDFQKKPDSGILYETFSLKNVDSGEFLGGLVVRILGFHCRDPGSVPGQGTEIPQAAKCGQKKRKKKVDSHKQCGPKRHICGTRCSPWTTRFLNFGLVTVKCMQRLRQS